MNCDNFTKEIKGECHIVILPRSIELVCDKPLSKSSTWCPECYANEFVQYKQKKEEQNDNL